MIKIIWLTAVPFERFWSLEFIGTMLSELLIPVLILVGSSIIFGVWGEKCARLMNKLAKRLSVLSLLEFHFDRINFIALKMGEKVSRAFKRIQTGLSDVNLLFLMGGILLLLIITVIS